MAMSQLLSYNNNTAPNYTFVGQGYCVDDQSQFAYTGLYCTNCTGAISIDDCASNCWELEETFLDPFLLEVNENNTNTNNMTITTVGFQAASESCECLLDTSGVNLTEDLLDRLEIRSLEEGYQVFVPGVMDDMETAPIAGSVEYDYPSGWSCFTFDTDYNATNQVSPSPSPYYPDTPSCMDQAGYFDMAGENCGWYVEHGCSYCDYFVNSYGISACQACCVCGGGIQLYPEGAPTPAPTEYQPTPWSYQEDDDNSFIVIMAVVIICNGAIAACIVHAKKRRNEAAPNTVAPSVATPSNNDNAETQQRRREAFEAKLVATTMIISKNDLIAVEPTVRNFGQNQVRPTAPMETEDDDIVVPPMFDVELGEDDAPTPLAESMRMDSENNNVMLQLRTEDSSTRKMVQCHCAICLSAYKVGDVVSWAAAEPEGENTLSLKCQHAFHTPCIVKFAEFNTRDSGSTTVKCPLCRQCFVS